MKIKRFLPNEPDNLHCLQSCIRMILDTTNPVASTQEDAEKFSGFVSGKQTWPHQAMLSFSTLGFEVIVIESFSHQLFAVDPKSAISLEYGMDLWEHIAQCSDIASASKIAAACINCNLIDFQQRIPTLADVQKLIGLGFFVVCNLDIGVLNGDGLYNGHFVIVEDVFFDRVIVQDPGPPASPNLVLPVDKFLKAWMSPIPKMANILAVRAPICTAPSQL